MNLGSVKSRCSMELASFYSHTLRLVVRLCLEMTVNINANARPAHARLAHNHFSHNRLARKRLLSNRRFGALDNLPPSEPAVPGRVPEPASGRLLVGVGAGR